MCLFKKEDFDIYDSEKDSSLFLRQEQIFNEIHNKRLKIIKDLNDKINYDNLKYKYESRRKINFKLKI